MDRQQEQEQEQESFTIISTDESFFFHDSLIRRVWIDESKRPIVRVTGSHKYPNMHFWGHKHGRKNSYSDSMTNSMVIHFLII